MPDLLASYDAVAISLGRLVLAYPVVSLLLITGGIVGAIILLGAYLTLPCTYQQGHQRKHAKK